MPENQDNQDVRDDLSRELTGAQAEVFLRAMRNFSMAIKNSVLYAPEHPIYKASIDNFKRSLEEWTVFQDSLDLGIAQTRLYLAGYKGIPADERCNEIAGHLHPRGVIAVSFLKGVGHDELAVFFDLIKQDKRDIREKGGIVNNLPDMERIIVKEIDYSSLLTEEKAKGPASEEDKMWQFLFDIGEDMKGGAELPESKIEFVREFFHDTQKSACVINKVYKEAMNNMKDDGTARDVRDTMAKVCDYFEKHSPNKGKDVKEDLMRIMSQLHPDLIKMIFERTMVNGRSFDLAEEVTKDFSDTYIAGFIESLVTQEDTFNENLLKVFDKLAPTEARAENVVSMVADRLLGRRVLNADALSKLQMSVREIFKAHPQSGFMTQMYNITVDAVMNKKIDSLVYMARLSPLLNKFAQSMAEDKLKKEEIWLLLNILWLESDPLEFNKFSSKLAGMLSELLDSRDTEKIREMLLFFTEKMRPEQYSDEQMSAEINDAISRLTSKEAIDSIVAMIPTANNQSLDDIADIVSRSRERSASPLVEAYLLEKNPAVRNKFKVVFGKNIPAITSEVLNRMEYVEASSARDLLGILREYDKENSNLIAKRFFFDRDPRLRWEGLEAFDPSGKEDIDAVFNMFAREKDPEVKKKAAEVIMMSRDPEVIKRTFAFVEKNFFRKGFLPYLVEIVGKTRCREALPELRRIFLKRVFFDTYARGSLKVTIMTTLGRMRIPEAMEIVKLGIKDRSGRVRKLSEILVKLETHDRTEADVENERSGF